ncbi:hypothetical protein ACLB2K_039480 [Fragaria x ananassa]
MVPSPQVPTLESRGDGGDVPETCCPRLIGDCREVDSQSVLDWGLRLMWRVSPRLIGDCHEVASQSTLDWGLRLMWRVEKDDLVQLWAAEGFIRSQGTREVEDVGRQYFEDLRSRSFFSQVPGGDQQIYKMHELIHGLARFVSTNLCFNMDESLLCLVYISPNARYASLLYENAQLSTLKGLKEFYKYKKLRTFTLLPKFPSILRPVMALPYVPSNLGEVPYEFFARLGCLRVLNLSQSAISELPESIGNLIHLRYLNLSHTLIEVLPKPITTICGLETLKLKSCPKLLHLPENLKDLIKLRERIQRTRVRHAPVILKKSNGPVHFEKVKSPRQIDGGDGRVRGAPGVGKEKGYQIEELKNMRCLRGSISITNLENVADFIQAEAAMLHNKQYIEVLKLEWNGIRCQMQQIQQEVLTGLEPHAGLKELRVAGYCGLLFPGWIANSAFSKLESIEFENCPFCELLPALGQLPALKKLLIQNMSTLKVVDHLFCGHSSAAFQSLETLTLRDMLYLTSLQCLDINRCPLLQSLPEGGLPSSLKTLIILESDILKDRCKVGEGADWKKIRWIPTILIENMVIPAQRPDNQVIGGHIWLTRGGNVGAVLLIIFKGSSTQSKQGLL